MKRSHAEKKLMGNLGGSKFSGEGFLGSDHRPIDEIASGDLLTLEKHHVSKEKLVQVLMHTYETAKKALGAEVLIRPGLTIAFHESMGRIPSPFPWDGVFEKGEAVVNDAEGSRLMVITRLGIHLIEKHSFFQGMGSYYRIDPETAIRIFRLAPEPK